MSDENTSNSDPAEGSSDEVGSRVWRGDEEGLTAPDGVLSADAAAVLGTPEPPPPTHADWRQLSDEVRRLAAQIAHGRA